MKPSLLFTIFKSYTIYKEITFSTLQNTIFNEKYSFLNPLTLV